MALATGTASNYQDLLARLITFLTTDSNLVAALQNWTVVRTVTAGGENDHLIRGPGYAGTDNIYLRILSANAGGNYGFTLHGFVSYNSLVANSGQPGISPPVGMALWNSSIPYWFVADGRRFIIIAKVSTYYMTMHGGFYLPYATPAAAPYPMFIAGSHVDATSLPYTTASQVVGSIWDAATDCAYVRHMDGSWVMCAVHNSSGSYNTGNIWPYDAYYGLVAAPDNSLAGWPISLSSVVSGNPHTYGEIDGILGLPYDGLSAEDTFTQDGANHIVIPSVYRTTVRSFAGVRLT